MEPLGTGIFLASLLNGLRHGLDVDHIAAIGDIVSAQGDRRRSLFLAGVYAAGHAVVVFCLGIAAIALGARIPTAIDAAMAKVVGITLVALGIYVLYSIFRHGRNARLRSRWQLATDIVSRLRRSHGPRTVIVEHEHEHSHDSMHVHPHVEELTGPKSSRRVVLAEKLHLHSHRHIAQMPPDPLPAYGSTATFGIGLLHGIGAETPTQVLLFMTAAGVGTFVFGISVLTAFVAGMLVSNGAIAVAFTFGARRGDGPSWMYSMLAFATAIFSLGVGLSYLLN